MTQATPNYSNLTFLDLRLANVERCNIWHPKGIDSWSLSDWAVALAGEVGETCDVIKKLNRYRDGLIGNSKPIEELYAQLADEIADVQIYLDLLAARRGIDLGAATVKKFDEVSRRNKFSIFLGA